MAKDEPNLSSHERALNIAEELLQKGKAIKLPGSG